MQKPVFLCAKCGECCRHLHLVPGTEKLHNNGICKYLVGNECSIYINRPFFCNHKKLYKEIYEYISLEEYYKEIKLTCLTFIRMKKHNEIARKNV